MSTTGTFCNKLNPLSYHYLHTACLTGDTSKVTELLDQGVEVDLRSTNLRHEQWTPLAWAARHGRREICQLLIASKATIDALGEDGLTPLMRSAAYGFAAVVAELLVHGADSGLRVPVPGTEFVGQTALAIAKTNAQEEALKSFHSHFLKVQLLNLSLVNSVLGADFFVVVGGWIRE